MFQEVVDYILLNPFPVSQTVYFLYCLSVSYKLRKSNSWTQEETFRNPIGSLVSILTCNLGGLILINVFVKGLGLASIFKDDFITGTVLMAWLMVYYSPFDVIYTLLSLKPVQIILSIVVGWKRSRDIVNGVFEGKSVYRSLSMTILLGVLSGWGGSLLFPLEAHFRMRTVHSDLHNPSNAFLSVVVAVIGSALFGPAYGYRGSSFFATYFTLAINNHLPFLQYNPYVSTIVSGTSVSKESSEMFIILVQAASVLLVESGLVGVVAYFVGSVGGFKGGRGGAPRVPTKVVKVPKEDESKKRK